jgi:hypothetical protein
MKIEFSPDADKELDELENDPSRIIILKAVRRALGHMETNLRHPSLNTHPYHLFEGPDGEKVFCAYAQNNTPAAYRILWYYGPGKNIITIIAIMPHL